MSNKTFGPLVIFYQSKKLTRCLEKLGEKCFFFVFRFPEIWWCPRGRAWPPSPSGSGGFDRAVRDRRCSEKQKKMNWIDFYWIVRFIFWWVKEIETYRRCKQKGLRKRWKTSNKLFMENFTSGGTGHYRPSRWNRLFSKEKNIVF